MGLFNLFKKQKANPLLHKHSLPPSIEHEKSNLIGRDFEFFITGDLEITAENQHQIVTPKSFQWIKVQKDGWPYYKVGQDEDSYLWEPTGIQMISIMK